MKIICVGRNYSEHIKELNNKPTSEPVIFMKPETALVPKRNPFFLPSFSQNVHYEAELVVRINRIGKNIQEKFAHKYYSEFSVGLDFTARDIQSELKEKGLPWEKAKAFDGSAAIGKMIPIETLEEASDPEFSLKINDELRQKARPSEMIFSINHLISYVSQFYTLKIGDLIFTGTPSGVGKLNVNDKLELFLEKQPVLSLNVK